MGQISTVPSLGFKVLPTDRESGPGAGAGATGNNSIFIGNDAGLNSGVPQLIVIGSESGKGGISDVTNLTGTTIVGAFSAQALVSAAATQGAITLLGSNNLTLAVHGDSSVIVGSGILPLTTNAAFQITQNVLIGNSIASDPTTTGPSKSVIIGYNACNVTGNTSSQNNVVIGTSAFPNGIGSCVDNVMIGFQVMGTSGVPGPSQNVVIGSGAKLGTVSSSDNVIIGYQASAPGASTVGGNIAIGQAVIGNTGSDTVGNNVVIGTNARIGSTQTTGNNVIIGANAGQSLNANTPTVGSALVIETNNNAGTAQKSLIFGNFLTGNLVLGNSISGTSQEVHGTNTVKLMNGTSGGGSPTNGGYFYSSAGALHWVDSSGFDSTLSFGSGQVGSVTGVALTNNAAANAGTLTNAPAIGNPTKWAPFNDNGTIRNIPMW